MRFNPHHLIASAALMLASCAGTETVRGFEQTTSEQVEIRNLLVARHQELQESVIRVSERVYVAAGFGLSTVSMIVGDDGIVIIDTNLDESSAARVFTEFRSITDKPVKAIIFTHGHDDHTGGASVFMEEGTEVWARAPFETEDIPFEQAGLTIQGLRGFRQFGVMVPEDEINHIGIAARYIPDSVSDPEARRTAEENAVHPTRTFAQKQVNLNIAGLHLELVAASGETDDQIFIWFESERVLFSGDNFYRSWPNLYAIRGTEYRDVHAWIESLTSMLAKKPHHLVAGHTRPVLGEAEVTEVLTNYRDAIEYVFDKTIEGMNRGMTPDELVEHARLPERYSNLDYLRPYYGHPDWGVRSIFSGYLGWFDGNPTKLFPLNPKEQARQVMELAGGRDQLEQSMHEAIDSGDYQWALELVDYLLQLAPEDPSLLRTKAEVLSLRAEMVLNLTARNYYRSYALELLEKTAQ